MIEESASEDKQEESLKKEVNKIILGNREITFLNNPGNWRIADVYKKNNIRFFKWHPHGEVANKIVEIMRKENRSYENILMEIYFNSDEKKVILP